jgi:hypothetical protein
MPSSQYIRTVRTEFTGTGSVASSSSTTRSSSSSSRENDNMEAQNIKYPPGLGLHSTWRSAPASVNINQMAGGSGSSSSSSSKHPQRPAVRIPFSNRRSLSSSSSTSRAPTSYFGNVSQRDPYSSWNYSLIYDSHPVSRTYRFATEMEPSQSIEPTAKTPPLKPLDRDERSKLVAGILLHRVHAVGKPLRRKPEDKEKPYVRSGLSRMVRMEA